MRSLWLGSPSSHCLHAFVQEEAAALIADWTQEERDYLREEVARTALHTPFRDGTVQDLAKKVRCDSSRHIAYLGMVPYAEQLYPRLQCIMLKC